MSMGEEEAVWWGVAGVEWVWKEEGVVEEPCVHCQCQCIDDY